MSANVIPVADTPSAHGQEAQLRELGEEYPPPATIYQDVQEDGAWFYARASGGEFDQYVGQVVAVFNRQIVGIGKDGRELRVQLARQYGQHPERFYLVFHE